MTFQTSQMFHNLATLIDSLVGLSELCALSSNRCFYNCRILSNPKFFSPLSYSIRIVKSGYMDFTLKPSYEIIHQ